MKFVPLFVGTSLDPDLNTDLHTIFMVPLLLWYVLSTLYALIVLFGFLGNLMVLHAFPKRGVLEHKKVQYVLTVSLAATDILVLLVHGVPTMGVFFADKWPFGGELCHVIALIKHTVFYMKLFSVILLCLHKAFTMCFPFRGMVMTKRSSIKTVIALLPLSLLLNTIGLMGSDQTAFSGLSCNAEIYLKKALNWEGYALLSFLGVIISILLASLVIISHIARGMRARRQEREVHFQRPHISRRRRFINFLRRNKTVASVVIVAVIFIITMIPLSLDHLLERLNVPTNPGMIIFGEIFAMVGVASSPVIYAAVNLPFLQYYQEGLWCL
ncbi:nociceptin receptor-like [Bolinopsis microptera]|uniref:nociceptin receptor-like n=1 Tax=Bolinopsis microptera TaxID=2820187 RepID=UPI00307A85D7